MYSTAIELLSKKSDKLFCMFIALKNLGKVLEEQVNIEAKKNKSIQIQKKKMTGITLKTEVVVCWK